MARELERSQNIANQPIEERIRIVTGIVDSSKKLRQYRRTRHAFVTHIANMSWFKLNVNDSLNSLKGQITNVSNVVHDVFTEGILDDANANVTENADDADDGSPRSVATADDVSDVEMMEAANRKIEELSSLCTVQDSEVSVGDSDIIVCCVCPNGDGDAMTSDAMTGNILHT